MKKILATMLTIVLAVSMVSCGTGSSTSDSSPESGSVSESGESKTDEDSTNGGAVSIAHDLGTIEVKTNPKKIVVMDFGFLDTINALGVEAELALPKKTLPEYLSKYADDGSVDLGGLKEFDIEAINSFKPDLIVISGRQQDFYDDLSSIAPTWLIDLRYNHYMDDFKRNMTTIGEVFELQDKVAESLSAIDESVAKAKESISKSEEKALIVLTNAGKISAYGSGSRFGFIHDVLGVKLADENIEASTHGMEVNFEYIGEKNPDVIFVVDRNTAIGSAGTEDEVALLENDLVAKTNAAKNDRIVVLNQDIWYLSGGGLESVQMMIDEIAAEFEA